VKDEYNQKNPLTFNATSQGVRFLQIMNI